MRGIMLRITIRQDPFWPLSLGVSRMTLDGSVERYQEVSDPLSSLKCKPLLIVGRITLYSLYSGTPLRKSVSIAEKAPTSRASYLLAQKAAVMP